MAVPGSRTNVGTPPTTVCNCSFLRLPPRGAHLATRGAFLNDHNPPSPNRSWIVHPAGQILDASSSRSPCPGDVNLSARCARFGTCLAHRVLHLKGLWPAGDGQDVALAFDRSDIELRC